MCLRWVRSIDSQQKNVLNWNGLFGFFQVQFRKSAPNHFMHESHFSSPNKEDQRSNEYKLTYFEFLFRLWNRPMSSLLFCLFLDRNQDFVAKGHTGPKPISRMAPLFHFFSLIKSKPNSNMRLPRKMWCAWRIESTLV